MVGIFRDEKVTELGLIIIGGVSWSSNVNPFDDHLLSNAILYSVPAIT